MSNQIIELQEPQGMKDVMLQYLSNEKKEKHKLEDSEDMNNALGGGFNQGSLSVVVARSGFGKTNYLIDTAYNLAKQGLKIVFASCELTAEKIAERFLARETGIAYNKIAGHFSNGDQKIGDAIGYLAENFDIDFIFDQGIENIKLQAGALPEEKGTNILIIDHLHEITTSQNLNTFQEFNFIIERLEELWKKTGMTIIAAAQFNKNKDRGVDNGGRGVDDIMGSSVLRNKASNILYLYESDGQEEHNKGEFKKKTTENMQCTLRLLKARDGWTGWETTMRYDKACCKFTIIKD